MSISFSGAGGLAVGAAVGWMVRGAAMTTNPDKARPLGYKAHADVNAAERKLFLAEKYIDPISDGKTSGAQAQRDATMAAKLIAQARTLLLPWLGSRNGRCAESEGQGEAE